MQLRYVFSELGQGLRRNLSMHLAVILTLFVSLTLVGLGVLLHLQANKAAEHWGSQLQITVWLCKERDDNPACTGVVTDAQKQAIAAEVDSNPEVADSHFETSEQAFEKVKELFGADKFEGPNPAATAQDMPQSVWITLKDPDKFQGITSAVVGLDGVSGIRDVREVIKPIDGAIKMLQWFAVGTAIFLVVAALLLVGNTVRLAAFARRKEIGIMRLVGASTMYITLPFLMEALVTAAIGVLLAGGALAAFMYFGIEQRAATGFAFMPWIGRTEYVQALWWIAIIGPALTLTSRSARTRNSSVPIALRSTRSLPRTREGRPVRLFPRTARRRLLAATAVCTLALGALAVPLALADDGNGLKDRQKHAHQQVRHAQQDLEDSSAAVRKAQAALEHAHVALTAARGDYQVASAKLQAAELRDQQMQAELEGAEQRLATAQQDVENGRTALESQREALTDTITSIYEQGDPELLALSALLDAKTPADLTRQMEARNVMVGREAHAYDDLHAAEVLLEVRQGQVQDARDAVEVQRAQAADHLVAMQDLRSKAAAAQAQVQALVASRAQASAAARAARQRDRQDLREAKKAEEHIKQQILAALRRARAAHGGYHGPTNGLFIRPVPGSVTSPFGYRIHPIYHYWGLHDGTDFGVACGEGMHAVADGTVIAKYWSDVYGNRLYLSLGTINGKNFTAVYNHATGYRVGVGDHVQQGDVVGYVGSTGWSTGCHLHFTLLVNGDAVDPMKYLP